VAAPTGVSETRRDVDQAPRWNSELLPTKVRFGVVEAINGNIRMLINADAATRTCAYLLLKAKRMAATNTKRRFQKIPGRRVG